ncbi:transposase [Streptomyces sp.]|uniref:transposase n=1 Tax=Streptomyces sp. TaxID=1931 RepID=UPI0034550CD6
MPGVGQGVAEVIIAETGGDMSRFAAAGHLASWAGVCPGHHESAGKHKSGPQTPREPVARRRPGHSGHGGLPHSRDHLPRRPLPPAHAQAGQEEGPGRLRTPAPDRGLAHAHQRCRLPGSRWRLLREVQPRASHAPHHPPGQRPRLHRPLRPHRGRMNTSHRSPH